MAVTGGGVEFYERVKELQDVQYESENKRLELEQQLNSYVKSDSRMARLKAGRLQNYWKKICEDEKKSQWRNEQLLQDFDRVEAHMASLDSRSERLRTMKKQYEEYIERMYPQWKEKVIFYQQQRIQAEKQTKDFATPASMGGPQQFPGSVVFPPYSHHQAQAQIQAEAQAQAHPQIASQYDSAGLQYASSVARAAQLATEAKLDQARSALQQQIKFAERGVDRPQQSVVPIDQQRPFSPGEAPRQYPGSVHHHPPPSAGSTLQTISSLPTGMSLTSLQARAMAENIDLTGTWESTEPGSTVEPTARQQEYSHKSRTLDREGIGYNTESIAPPAMAVDDYSAENTVETMTSPKQTTVKPATNQRSSTVPMHGNGEQHEDEVDTWRTDASSPNAAQYSNRSHQSNTGKMTTPRSARDEGEVFSDADSLPLSSHDIIPSGKEHEEPGRSYTLEGPASRKNSQSSILEEKSEEHSIYPEASVTLAGLYNMLDTVQEALPETRCPSEFYRSQIPPQSVRKDIITNANKGMMLSHVNSASVSMVVLEQIPLLVVNSDSGTLLPDKYLYMSQPSHDIETVRGHIDLTCLGFWDRLYEHLVALVRFGIMQPETTADTFGPLIIADDSPYEDKARVLLTGLLSDLEVVEPNSPSSTATLSLAPTPRSKQQPRPVPREEVPPLDLPVSSKDRSEDQDYIPNPMPVDTTGTPALTQTAAYRQLLGNTLSTQMGAEYEDSEADEDDIEKQISKSLTSPRIKSSQPRLSSQTSEKVTTKIPDGRHGDTAQGSDVSSPSNSLPLSPTSPAGYVPSGLTNTGKSTLSMSSTGKSAKKPAFRFGDSDTDEDIDLMGTGPGSSSMKHGLEKDDFDFYD